MDLFNQFLEIIKQLNNIGIVPTLMGSLGLEYLTKVNWSPSDIDIHVPGDPRGWEAPDELRIFQWSSIYDVMTRLGYELVDIHEHEFKRGETHVEYGTINSLEDFAGIKEEELKKVEVEGVEFRLPNLQQFLAIYQASSKDSYRNENNNDKDFKKIKWLEELLYLN